MQDFGPVESTLTSRLLDGLSALTYPVAAFVGDLFSQGPNDLQRWRENAREELAHLDHHCPFEAAVIRSVARAFKSTPARLIERFSTGEYPLMIRGFTVHDGSSNFYIAEKRCCLGDISFESYLIGRNVEGAPPREGISIDNRWFMQNPTESCGRYIYLAVGEKVERVEEARNARLRQEMLAGLDVLKEPSAPCPYPLTEERAFLDLPGEHNSWQYLLRGFVSDIKPVAIACDRTIADDYFRAANPLSCYPAFHFQLQVGERAFDVLTSDLSLKAGEAVIHARLNYETRWPRSAQFIDAEIIAVPK